MKIRQDEKIKKIITTLKVKASRKQLVNKYGVIDVVAYDVYVRGEHIGRIAEKYRGIKWLFDMISKKCPEISLSIQEVRKRHPQVCRIDDVFCWLKLEGSDCTYLEIFNYSNMIDMHYQEIEKVRERLAKDGLEIANSQCVIEKGQVC